VIHTTWLDEVCLITLDRPERRNALDRAMLDKLAEALGRAAERRARVVVLTGGAGSFCAGADLTEIEDEGFVAALMSVLQGLTEFPACTIAAIDGPALGAGAQLAVACDLRVATEASVLGIPAARLGIVIDVWTVRSLVALAGGATARAMLLSAQTISGSGAYRLGLVQRVGDLRATLKWADEIAQLAPLSVAGHKLALEQLDDTFEVRAAREAAWSSADIAEGQAAFLAKRAPHFTGK